MDKEIDKIITNLENCFGIFDYVITPIESNLLVSYIKTLQQQVKKQKEVINKIKEICASVPEDWAICGVEKIYEIEETLKEVSNNE